MADVCKCLRPLGKFSTGVGWYCADCGKRIGL